LVIKKKNSRRLTYRITDRASCESAIRFAVVFYFIGVGSGAIHAAVDILQSGPAPERGTDALLDLVPLAYIGLIAVLAFRVHQHKSRVASTLLFAMFIGNLLIAYMKYGFAAGTGFGLGFAFQMLTGFIYFLGMRGTYLWHSTYRDAPQAHEAESTEDDTSSSEQDEQEALARSCDDLCPKCFEYFEADELNCRYCGTDLPSRSSLART
jgi:hypothetical protein